MNKLILNRKDAYTYTISEYSTHELSLIKYFLTDDVRHHAEKFIDQFTDEFFREDKKFDEKPVALNFCYLKPGNFKMVIGEMYVGKSETPIEIELERNNFISMLREWDHFYRQRTEAIEIIQYNDGYVKINGWESTS